MAKLTHFDDEGRSQMVDVSGKPESRRVATASGLVLMNAETQAQIRARQIQKGDVLGIARIAAILGTKRTSDLIPLCHPLRLSGVTVEFSFPDSTSVRIVSTVTATERTGVEMEALLAVSIAGLTIYDMCKSIDKKISLTHIRLERKTGGKTGDFDRSLLDSKVSYED